MPVVINEFEVVPQPSQPAEAPTGPAPTTPPKLDPHEIARILRARARRALRVRAY